MIFSCFSRPGANLISPVTPKVPVIPDPLVWLCFVIERQVIHRTYVESGNIQTFRAGKTSPFTTITSGLSC